MKHRTCRIGSAENDVSELLRSLANYFCASKNPLKRCGRNQNCIDLFRYYWKQFNTTLYRFLFDEAGARKSLLYVKPAQEQREPFIHTLPIWALWECTQWGSYSIHICSYFMKRMRNFTFLGRKLYFMSPQWRGLWIWLNYSIIRWVFKSLFAYEGKSFRAVLLCELDSLVILVYKTTWYILALMHVLVWYY